MCAYCYTGGASGSTFRNAVSAFSAPSSSISTGLNADGIELTTTPAAPPLTSAEAMEARLARLEEQQLRILSLLEAKLK